jgi:hypothetical protein
MLDKLYAVARAVALIVAIAGAFVVVPYAALLLVVLGIVAGVGISSEHTTTVMITALVLAGGSKVVEAIPQVGVGLGSVLSSIGTAYMAAALTAIVMGIAMRTKSEWIK